MSSPPATPLRPGVSPVLQEALRRRQLLSSAQANGGAKAWIQLLLAVLCLYDANHMFLLKCITSHPAQVASSVLYLVEMSAFAVLLTSSLTSIWNKIALLHSMSPISLNTAQFKLLRLDPNSTGFSKSPDPKPVTPTTTSPLPGPLVSPSMSMTPINMSHHSWLSQSPSSPVNVTPPPVTNLRSGQYPNSPSSPVTDTSQLAAYLASYSQWEASQSILEPDTASQTSQPGAASLWQGHGYVSGRQLDFSPSVGGQQTRPVYQLSSTLPVTIGQSNSSDANTIQDKSQSKVLSHRLGIDPMELVSWNENLRVWLTQTILKPLVSEIDRVNTTLPRLGVGDVTVGSVPVDRLRKVQTLPQVTTNLTSLSALIPYLEVSSDQSYLVARLRELASTGAMSKYRWSAGGENWSDRLPSDSEIVMHCLATYMDTRLLSSAGDVGGNLASFTGRHFVKYGDKLRKEDKNCLAILQTSKSPIHYVVQVGDKQLDVGAGRNNMIHSILLFLHTIKMEKSGMLGRVNFGLSGLNMLWVLD